MRVDNRKNANMLLVSHIEYGIRKPTNQHSSNPWPDLTSDAWMATNERVGCVDSREEILAENDGEASMQFVVRVVRHSNGRLWPVTTQKLGLNFFPGNAASGIRVGVR